MAPATGNNGKTALGVIRQQTQTSLDSLASAALPNFNRCPASGEQYHRAMADGMRGLLQWQLVSIDRELDRPDRSSQPRAPGDGIETPWLKARGRTALLCLWPLAVIAICTVVCLIVWKSMA